MSVIENFLVNTGNFDSIIQTLINDQNTPSRITDTYFKSLGFQNPSDLLVIHLMKGLNILEEDGSTNERFRELVDPSSTQQAIAKGVTEAYEGLFRMEPQIHKMQHDELQKIFSEVFAGQKSELIFKYMANTFSKLVSYAGTTNIEQALKESEKQQAQVEAEVTEEKPIKSKQDEVVETIRESAVNAHSNGVHNNGIENGPYVNGQNELDSHAAHAEQEPDADPEPEISEPKNETSKEEKGGISFEDLVGLNSPDSPKPEVQPLPHHKKIEEKDNGTESSQEDLGTAKAGESHVNGNISQPESGNGAVNNGTADEYQNNSEQTNPLITSDQPVNGFDDSETKENLAETSIDISNNSGSTLSEESSRLQDDQKLQKALIKKADLLYKLERYESLLPTLDQIIAYFDRADEPFLKEAVSTAVIRRAFVLYNLKRYEQALLALDRVITLFSYSDNKNLYEQASQAMLYKAKILEETNRMEQVLPLFNSIIERLGNTDKPELTEQIDEIFLKRLDMLMEAGRTEEVLAATDQLIERFKHNKEKLKYFEEAMFKKAEILENLNKYEEALEAYSNFLEKFG